MALGTTIGRVSIKVIPDTTTFKRDLERKLDRLENGLKVKVLAVIDVTKMKRELLQTIREINAENKTANSRKIRLGTILEFDRKELARVTREYEALSRANPVKLKTELSGIHSGLPEVRIKAHLRLVRKNLQDVKKQLEDWRRDIDPLIIDVRLNLSESRLRAIHARLLLLTRPRSVLISPKANEGAFAKVSTMLAALSGGRVLGSALRNMGDFLKTLDKSVPMIGALSLGLAQLVSFSGAAASNFFALASSLASIIPAALALPGILGGIAIGMTASVIAFKDFNKIFPDFKKKWEATKKIVSDNFWEKAKAPFRELIDELLPKFNQGLEKTGTALGGFFGTLATALNQKLGPALKGMFENLNESINIFKGHTGSIAGIITSLGNVGSARLPQLAKWMGKLMDQFDAFLTKAANNGDLDRWIDNGVEALKDLGGVLKGVFDIFAGLGKAAKAAGGSTLGVLADTLKQLGAAINSPGVQKGLVTFFKATHDGMKALFDTAGPGLKELFKSLATLSTTILPLAGKTLGTFLGAIGNALSDPRVMSSIELMFEGIARGIDALQPALPPLARALGTIGEVVGTFASVLGPLFAEVLGTLADALVTLEPPVSLIIGLLGETLTEIWRTAGPLITELAGALSGLLLKGFEALSAVLPLIIDAFRNFVDTAGPPLIQLFEDLAPLIGPVVEALGTSFVTILESLGPIIAELAPVLADVFVKAFQALAEILPPLVTVLAELAETVAPILAEILRDLAPILPELAKAFADMLVALLPLLPELTDLAIEILPLIPPLIQLLIDVLPFLVSMFENAVKSITGFLEMFKGMLQQVKGWVTGDWKMIWTSFGTILSGAWKVIDGILTAALGKMWTDFKGLFPKIGAALRDGSVQIIDFFRALPRRIVDAVGNLNNLLINAGVDLIKGFIGGIGSMFGEVQNKLGDLTSKLTSWKGPESLDRVLLVGAGKLVINGFINGLESRYAAVRKSLRGITNEIAGTTITPPSVAQVAMAQRAQGLNGALGTGTGAVTNKTLVYNAAPGSSLGSEEDLFAASSRTRMVGW